jgi:phosphoglycerate dehydrogenase-like enzyme
MSTAAESVPARPDARRLRVVLAGNIVTANEPRLRAKADFPIEVDCLADDAPDSRRDAALAQADVLVCTSLRRAPPDGSPLRLVQLQAAGYDGIDFACVPPAASVCNAFGHTNAIAEYVVMTMLMWTHRWKPVEESFRAGSWEYSGAQVGPLRDELAGKTVGILGYGQMGAAIAARARAMGTRVVACSRQSKPGAEVDAFLPLARLDEFLAGCDFVVVCIAHVPETTGLIDSRRLARMKREAVLVNVARGPVVVEQDLFEALTGGTIAGAVIDVWWRYPDASDPRRRGSRFPFHELPNVLMTPHSSGWTEQMMDRRWDMIVANLRALWRGEPLRHVVRAARS